MTKFANWTRAELRDAEREIERNISYLECDFEDAKARYHESCGNDTEAEEKMATTEEQLKFAKEELAAVEEQLERGGESKEAAMATTAIEQMSGGAAEKKNARDAYDAGFKAPIDTESVQKKATEAIARAYKKAEESGRPLRVLLVEATYPFDGLQNHLVQRDYEYRLNQIYGFKRKTYKHRVEMAALEDTLTRMGKADARDLAIHKIIEAEIERVEHGGKAAEQTAPTIEPEALVEDDGSNDDADEPAYISAAPRFSESDEDDDLADEYWVVEPAVEVEPVVPAAKIAAEIVGDDEDGELDYNVQLYLRQLKLKDLQAKLKVACEAAQEYLERHEQLTDRFDRFYNAGAITCYRDDVEYLERAIPELEREIETLADLLYIPHDKMYEPDDTNPSVQAYLKKEALKSIDASEPATEVEDVAQTADSDFEEIEVINPAVFAPAPSDKLLKIRGCIFTHSQYTFEEIADYLDKIEACDAGADQVFVTDDEALIENFSDDYTPEEYAVGFRGRLLTSTLNLIKAKVKSFDNPDGTYTPHFAVLKYDAEPVEDDDDEDSEPEPPTASETLNASEPLAIYADNLPCYDEPEPPTELTEEIPTNIADKIAYCNKLLTTQTCHPKYFLDAMEDLQAMLDGNPVAIDAYNALVERYNEIVHAKGGDFLDCLSPIRADLDEMTTAEPTCDTSALPNYDEPELATDSNTEQEETTLENENISTILHQVQHAEDVAKNTIREFFKVADSYSDNTPEDNDMAALYRMFAGEVYKIWREINKVRKTTGALLKNTTTATQAPDDTPPLCTTTAIPFTGLLSEQTWLYMSQSTFENYLAGKKWHAHIPEITAKDAAAALNILRQITPTEYRVTHTYHGEFGERQEYCKGDNGVDILKWYSPTYRNLPEHSDELMSIVFFRNDTPVAQIHIPARWLNGKLVFESDRESLTAEQIAEVQEFLGLPPQEQVTEMPTLKISKAPAGESTTFKISQNPRDDEPANNSIDSETPATETTILSPPLDSTALTKDLADTVLEVKIAADEIEEMLAGGYDLSDSGCNSISKAQELLRQAITELGKLKSIDSAA